MFGNIASKKLLCHKTKMGKHFGFGGTSLVSAWYFLPSSFQGDSGSFGAFYDFHQPFISKPMVVELNRKPEYESLWASSVCRWLRYVRQFGTDVMCWRSFWGPLACHYFWTNCHLKRLQIVDLTDKTVLQVHLWCTHYYTLYLWPLGKIILTLIGTFSVFGNISKTAEGTCVGVRKYAPVVRAGMVMHIMLIFKCLEFILGHLLYNKKWIKIGCWRLVGSVCLLFHTHEDGHE